MEFFVNLPMACINAAIADHFIMLFRDMPDKALDKFHNRDGFFHIFVIFMAVVMESDKITIVAVNPGGGDDRASEIAPDVLNNCFRITFVWPGIHVKAIFMIPVALGFHFFKGRADFGLHFAQEGSTESIPQECVVEIINVPPEAIIAVAAF